MVHSVSGWTRAVQVKLWDSLRTRAIPERLRGAFTTRRYTIPRLPLPLPLPCYRDRSTLFLHGVCMLRECIYGECAHEHVRRTLTLTLTLTLTHTITAYSVSGNVVRVCILICATRQKPCRKKSLPQRSTSYRVCLLITFCIVYHR